MRLASHLHRHRSSVVGIMLCSGHGLLGCGGRERPRRDQTWMSLIIAKRRTLGLNGSGNRTVAELVEGKARM